MTRRPCPEQARMENWFLVDLNTGDSSQETSAPEQSTSGPLLPPTVDQMAEFMSCHQNSDPAYLFQQAATHSVHPHAPQTLLESLYPAPTAIDAQYHTQQSAPSDFGHAAKRPRRSQDNVHAAAPVRPDAHPRLPSSHLPDDHQDREEIDAWVSVLRPRIRADNPLLQLQRSCWQAIQLTRRSFTVQRAARRVFGSFSQTFSSVPVGPYHLETDPAPQAAPQSILHTTSVAAPPTFSMSGHNVSATATQAMAFAGTSNHLTESSLSQDFVFSFEHSMPSIAWPNDTQAPYATVAAEAHNEHALSHDTLAQHTASCPEAFLAPANNDQASLPDTISPQNTATPASALITPRAAAPHSFPSVETTTQLDSFLKGYDPDADFYGAGLNDSSTVDESLAFLSSWPHIVDSSDHDDANNAADDAVIQSSDGLDQEGMSVIPAPSRPRLRIVTDLGPNSRTFSPFPESS